MAIDVQEVRNDKKKMMGKLYCSDDAKIVEVKVKHDLMRIHFPPDTPLQFEFAHDSITK